MTLHRKKSGFTLVELAIALIIVTLLTTGLLMSLGTQRELIKVRETEKILADAQEALIGFAMTNGRLPRPAVSAIDGTEQANCVDESACTGFLPWQALGVQGVDSWGKRLRYSVTPTFTTDIPRFSLSTFGTKKIRGRDDTGNFIYLFGQAANCAIDKPCAPAVIFSHGQNRLGTTIDGTPLAGGTATSLDEISNNTGSTGPSAGTIYISRTFTENTAVTGGEFDDLVTWLSPNILYNRMIAAGKLP